MSYADRSGTVLKTGKIGRVNCLNQTMMMPGERAKVGWSGQVRLETLKERDALRINAMLCTFLTPLRWLWSSWPDYVKQGPDTGLVPPTRSYIYHDRLGIGAEIGASSYNSYYEWFEDNQIRIHNEWFKWPEDADIDQSDWVLGGPDGMPAVPLQAAWNRARYDATPDDADDYEQGIASSKFDVRDLAETEAKFRGAMKRDVFSFGRWMEIVNEIWRGDGSREVDQVPMLLDKVEVGVSPRSIPATDSAGLGQWQSLYDFNVNHNVGTVIAPEHCIISTFMIIRFAPILEMTAPLARPVANDWYELVGDPEYLSAAKPKLVEFRDMLDSNSSSAIGYLPAGYQWRMGHDVIGRQIDTQDSFPYMQNPTTQAECKDASRVKDAFRNQTLGDYLVDLYYTHKSQLPIGDSMDSYMSGMVDDATPRPGGRNQEFPKGGKML